MWLRCFMLALLGVAPCFGDEGAAEQQRALQHGAIELPSSRELESPESKHSAWEDRRWAVHLAGSLWGSPSGVIGLNGDYALLPWFSLSTSVGVAGLYYAGANIAIAQSARLRALLDTTKAFTVAAGASMGPYELGTYCVDCSPDGETIWVWDWAYWADFSIGYEYRSSALEHSAAAGLSIQLNVGLEYLLNAENDACFKRAGAYGGSDHDTCTSDATVRHVVFPFVQVMAGFAF